MLIWITGNDFIKASKFLEEIEDEYAIPAMRSLAGVVGNYDLIDSSTQISNCRSLSYRLHIVCIRGFVGGLIEGGSPNTQDYVALNFCNDPILQDDERSNCYQEALWLLSVYLSKDRYEDVCKKLNGTYRKFCG